MNLQGALHFAASAGAVFAVSFAGTFLLLKPKADVPQGSRRAAWAKMADCDSPLVIEAIGADFQWHFCWLGPDGKEESGDEIDLGRRLVIPSQAPVEIRLSSRDYLYGFSQPDLEINEVAVPGRVNVLTFQTPHSGSFPLRSDPLCGYRWQHDEEMGRIVVKAPAGSR